MSASFGPGWTGIVGANGAGKSTLVRHLLRQAGHAGPQGFWLDELGGIRTLYLGQELRQEDARHMRGIMGELSPDKRGRLLSNVVQLGSDAKRLLAGGRFSPGGAEKARACPCRAARPRAYRAG